MGTRKTERRRRLFGAGTVALEHVLRFEMDDDPRRGKYMGPICGSFGSRDGAITGTELDLDHYPSRCMGGRTTLLTCRACNNETGRKIDWHAKASAETAAFVRGDAGRGGSIQARRAPSARPLQR